MKILLTGIFAGILICCVIYFFYSTFQCGNAESINWQEDPAKWIQGPIESRLERLVNDVENHQKYEIKVAEQINLLQSRILALETALKTHRIALPDSNTPFKPILIYPMPGAKYDIYGRRRHVPQISIQQEEPNNIKK